ncbi:hypothetical protein SNE40_023127 [Patella caerulea]|uniref:Uncharacterized protein n=1 Tax=Patella caerulea TaxID=87958 RepID=A0AAN8FXY2_PATCE
MNISGVSERDSRESDQTVSHPFDYTRRPPENDYYQGTGTIPVPVEHGESLGFSQIPQDLDVPGRGSMEDDPAISNRFDSTHRPPEGNGLPIPTWIPSLPGFSSPPLAEPYLNR